MDENMRPSLQQRDSPRFRSCGRHDCHRLHDHPSFSQIYEHFYESLYLVLARAL
jgi:hypothetical protein